MLNNYIYLVISPNGEKRFIERNDIYNNHFQYLHDFSKQDEYLRLHSFGLTFTLYDEQARLFFLQELADSHNIIIENTKLRSFENFSALLLYLPSSVTEIQQKSIHSYEAELIDTKHLFLLAYDEKSNVFDDLQTANLNSKTVIQLLNSYLEKHLTKENEHSTKTHK